MAQLAEQVAAAQKSAASAQAEATSLKQQLQQQEASLSSKQQRVAELKAKVRGNSSRLDR